MIKNPSEELAALSGLVGAWLKPMRWREGDTERLAGRWPCRADWLAIRKGLERIRRKVEMLEKAGNLGGYSHADEPKRCKTCGDGVASGDQCRDCRGFS